MLRARITATTNARLDYVLICPKLEPLQVLVGSSRKILGGREDSWRKRRFLAEEMSLAAG
jgi:hypothetical protein